MVNTWDIDIEVGKFVAEHTNQDQEHQLPPPISPPLLLFQISPLVLTLPLSALVVILAGAVLAIGALDRRLGRGFCCRGGRCSR